MPQRKIDWTNTVFLVVSHLLAVAAIVYMCTIRFSWWTVGLALLWMGLCSISITGGYHRLFAHQSHRASGIVKAFYLTFGAAAIQNSALKWSADHRVHHARTDTDDDPYNIQRGFWWAHIGWVFFEDSRRKDLSMARDLAEDPQVRFQDRHYLALAIVVGCLLPAVIALSWGDPIGALLVAGFLRLVLQWHATFSINSVAHCVGTRPYSTKTSARDSFWTAPLSLGESYHNFHHCFQADYRNGVRWYDFDPTKWFVWGLSKVRLTWNLKRTPSRAIERARQAVLAERAQAATH